LLKSFITSCQGRIPIVSVPAHRSAFRRASVLCVRTFHSTIVHSGLRTLNSELWFTPLERPGIYADDVRNRKRQLLIEGGGKALPFLTGLTLFFDPLRKFTRSGINGNQLTFLDERRNAKDITGF
jgi:hypothetical protein